MNEWSHESEPLNALGVVARLGDFSRIRSPAKCAARIGQAFSETNGTVGLSPGAVEEVPGSYVYPAWRTSLTNYSDIKRNGRVFSDGVGVFSPEILEKVWREYALGRERPTLLQIRWAGM